MVGEASGHTATRGNAQQALTSAGRLFKDQSLFHIGHEPPLHIIQMQQGIEPVVILIAIHQLRAMCQESSIKEKEIRITENSNIYTKEY